MTIKKRKPLFAAIPFSRWIVYLVIFSFLPLLLIGYRGFKKNQEWDEIRMRLLTLQSLAESKARKQYINTIVRSHFSEVDQFYLDGQLESIAFLRKEKEALEKIIQNPTFTGNESAEKRFSFLSSKENRLEFTQGSAQTAEGIQEAAVMLAHPVEIDAQDLKEILTRIEGTRKGKPQLIITDFKLIKKAHLSGNEVFDLNMKLLKREFL